MEIKLMKVNLMEVKLVNVFPPKQVQDFGTDLVLTAEEIFVSPQTIPLWNRSKSSDLEQLKDDIRNGDKPFISVNYESDINRYSLIDGYPAFMAYQELDIGSIHVKLIGENNYCLCNNRSWELNDTDIDRFIDIFSQYFPS